MQIGFWTERNPAGPDALLPLVVERDAAGSFQVRLAKDGEEPTKCHDDLRQGCFADPLFVAIDVGNYFNYIVSNCKDGTGLCIRLFKALQLNLQRQNCAACGSTITDARLSHHYNHPDFPSLNIWLTLCGRCQLTLATMLGEPSFSIPSCIAIARDDFEKAVKTGDIDEVATALTSLQLTSASYNRMVEETISQSDRRFSVATIYSGGLRFKLRLILPTEDSTEGVQAELGLRGHPVRISFRNPPDVTPRSEYTWSEVWNETLFSLCQISIEALFPSSADFSKEAFIATAPAGKTVSKDVPRLNLPAVTNITWYAGGKITAAGRKRIAELESRRYGFRDGFNFGPFRVEFHTAGGEGLLLPAEARDLENKIGQWLESRGRILPEEHDGHWQRFYSDDFAAWLLLGPMIKTEKFR